MSDKIARITNTTRSNLPIHAASPAIPPNPNIAAMIAITKKINAQRNMGGPLLIGK